MATACTGKDAKETRQIRLSVSAPGAYCHGRRDCGQDTEIGLHGLDEAKVAASRGGWSQQMWETVGGDVAGPPQRLLRTTTAGDALVAKHQTNRGLRQGPSFVREFVELLDVRTRGGKPHRICCPVVQRKIMRFLVSLFVVRRGITGSLHPHW